MVHLLSQLDPMVWLMMVVVAIGFVVAAVVLVDLLPGAGRRESGETGTEPRPPVAGATRRPRRADRQGARPLAARHPDRSIRPLRHTSSPSG